MAKRKVRAKFDIFFDEIIDWDDSLDHFDIIPNHVKKKYGLKIKYSDIGLEEAYELDPEKDIIPEIKNEN